ncbi:hypothetical protein GT755_00580 [Herbidospora sp. NEAU-GS84]|uniref:Ribosomal protein L7/L12 C-terminal domain-containing protein n=1 Tax=Herbidospora solisilvae TaxID=2696284 RepID=A0A7C9MZT8_9ACTN|nr:hypothetical protein [Herbidospora solisilvae]NAS20174.1 hypothetical protein [Herbidospora solisilvae]
MGTVGPAEILVLLILLGVIAGIVLLAVRASGGRPRAQVAYWAPGVIPQIAEPIRERVRELGAEGRVVEAIKLVRQETGLGLRDAKFVTESIIAGRYLPTSTERALQTGPDLAGRVRELKEAGRTEQAVFLVRGETGMNQEQAEAFVDLI